jgi:copper(I)-binding protein
MSRAINMHLTLIWSIQMNRIATLTLAVCLAITLVAVNLETRAFAHSSHIGKILLIHPWARPNIPNRPIVAYLTLLNDGEAPDRLIGARSTEFEAIEIHMAAMEGEMMKMKPVDAVDLPAGEAVKLEPGGFHLMLFGPSRQFVEGDHFPMILTLEKAGEVEIDVVFEKSGAD